MFPLLSLAVVMVATKIAAAAKKKNRCAAPRDAAVQDVAAHSPTVSSETTAVCPITSSASTPEHFGSAGNSGDSAVYSLLTVQKNVCQFSIVGISEVTAQAEVTSANWDVRQGVHTSCAAPCSSSPLVTFELKVGEFDAIPCTWNESSPLDNTVSGIGHSVAGASGSKKIAVTGDLAPAVTIENVPTISSGNQPVARDNIDDVALSHNEYAVQQDQEINTLMGQDDPGQPSTAVTNQGLVSIDAAPSNSQAQANSVRPPDSADDPRLGRFNGAGLSNSKYKLHVLKLLAERIPLPPPELIVTNRRLVRALPVSLAGQVKMWKQAYNRGA